MSNSGLYYRDPNETALAQRPTPQPHNNGQDPSGLTIPLDQIKQIAKMYANFHGIIKWGAKLAGQKIPKDLDDAMLALASDNPLALQELQGMADANDKGPQDPEVLQPQPRLGERILTRDMASIAYKMHMEGASFRQIAEDFTRDGYPCSHTTVVAYVDEYEHFLQEQMSHRYAPLINALKLLALIGIPTLAALLIGHFIW